MKILVLTTYFPPDTAIAAVRPFMFSKYLTELGHQVTVIRSGELWRQPDNSLKHQDSNLRIFTVLGNKSPAVMYEQGTYCAHNIGSLSQRRDRLKFRLPFFVLSIIRLRWHVVNLFDFLVGGIRRRNGIISTIENNLEHDAFDAVFATFGNIENIYAGQYAAKKYAAKLIIDFRDPIVQTFQWGINYLCRKLIERIVLTWADAYTAVSTGLNERISKYATAPVYTLYNGDEPTFDQRGNGGIAKSENKQ